MLMAEGKIQTVFTEQAKEILYPVWKYCILRYVRRNNYFGECEKSKYLK